MFKLGTTTANPRVTTVGSCRLEMALQAAASHYQFVLNHSVDYGFVHTTPEALQLIRWMRGEIVIPESLWPFVSTNPYNEVQPNGLETDAVAIEISNTHPVSFDGYALQLNFMRDSLNDVPELWQIWRKYPGAKRVDVRMAEFNKTESFARIDPARRAILERAIMVTQTAAMVRADLAAIRTYMPAAFFIMTYATMSDERPDMLTRNKAIVAITEACAAEQIPLFNPTAQMQVFGIEQAFAKAGKDIHHYTDAFTEHLGDTLSGLLGLNKREVPVENDKVLLTRRLKKIHIEEDPHKALELADALLALSASAQVAWVVKARVYTHTNQWPVATKCWERVLQLAPQDVALRIEAMAAAQTSADYVWAAALLEQLYAQGAAAQICPVLAANIYLASNNTVAAIGALRTQAATHDVAPVLELIEAAKQPTWLAAAACRAVAEAGNPRLIETVRTGLCANAMNDAVRAAQSGDVNSEADHLRLAQFVATGDSDLTLRVQAVVTAAMGSALAIAATQVSAGALQAERLAMLVELGTISSETALPAAELLALCGMHAKAASLLSQAFPDASERAQKAILRQLGLVGAAAIQQDDLPAAHAYVRVLQQHAPASPVAIKLLSATLKRETRLMRAQEATVTARMLLELDPHNSEALRLIAFAPDSSASERKTCLKDLLAQDTKALSALKKHLENALTQEQLDLADAYYTAWVNHAGTNTETEACRKKLVAQRMVRFQHAVEASPGDVAALADALLALEPNNPQLLKLAARALAKQAAWYAAHAYATRLVTLMPTDDDAVDLLAKCARHIVTTPHKSVRSA